MGSPRFDPPDPEGHHDDLTTDELDGLTLAVPDDPRELAVDREAWLAERERDAASPSAPPPPRRSPDGRRPGSAARRSRLTLTAAVLVVSMVVVAVSGAIGAFFVPNSTPTPPQAPLASVNPPPGQVGGLLPDALLESASGSVAARSLRPAVIALIPMPCGDCQTWLTEVRSQTAEFGLDVTLVVGPDQVAEGATIESALNSIRIDLLRDPSDAFATAYQPTGRTLLLVRDDGVVTDVLSDPPVDLRIESALLPLSEDLLSRV